METYEIPQPQFYGPQENSPKKKNYLKISLVIGIIFVIFISLSILFIFDEKTVSDEEIEKTISQEKRVIIDPDTENLLQAFPQNIEEGVIDCGVSTKLSELPIIYGDKPKIEEVYPPEILELYEEDCRETGDCGGWCGEKGCSSWEEAEEIMVLFYTPSVRDYSSDKAVLCMGNALNKCEKAIVTLQGENLEEARYKHIRVIESLGFNELKECEISVKYFWKDSKGDLGGSQNHLCGFELDHLIEEHSCGSPVPLISGDCPWNGEPGAIVEGILDVMNAELLAETWDKETYSGEPHCEFLGETEINMSIVR